MSTLTSFATHAATFLLGTVVGAAGAYLADRFTDQRRRQEARAAARDIFSSIERAMPELIREMRADLTGNPTTRDFFVLPNKGVKLSGSSTSYFVYYESEHPDLTGKVSILENRGYVSDITASTAAKYRMAEEFVHLVVPTK